MKRKITAIIVMAMAVVSLASCTGGSTSDYQSAVESGVESYTDTYSVAESNSMGLASDSVSNAKSISGSDSAGKKNESTANETQGTKTSSGNEAETTSTDTKLSNEKIVYRANITLETAEFKESEDKINELIKAYGIVVDEKNYDTYNNAKRVVLYLRVPSNNFQTVVNSMGDIGRVKSSYINSENITQKYIDVESRLSAKKKRVERINDFISKTTDYDELRSLYNDLEQAEYELENLQSQLQNMNIDLAYSYVDITMTDTHRYTDTGEELGTDSWFTQRAYDIWNSLRVFRTILNGILVCIIYLFPYLLVAGIVTVLIIRQHRKKKGNAKKTKGSPKKPLPLTFENKESKDNKDNND